MPKIMFRPNPVPPPFTPPAPSYDTTSTIKLFPFPFENGDAVRLELPSLNVPDYYCFKIYQFNTELGIYQSVSEDIHEQVSQPTTTYFDATNNSLANGDFEMRFYNKDIALIWTIKATRID